MRALLCIVCICGMHSYGPVDVSIFATVYTVYTLRTELKRFNGFTGVNTRAVNYLSHCCHTPVTPLFSIYLHRVTGSLDKTRCRRMYLRLPVTLSH